MAIFGRTVNLIAPIFIVTSPISSYAKQIYNIHKSKSASGFSLETPLIMLVASIMKVFYYIPTRFATSLLIQAVLMIMVHVVLLKLLLDHGLEGVGRAGLATDVGEKKRWSHKWASAKALAGGSAGRQHGRQRKTHAPWRRPCNFWQWHEPLPYWRFLALLTLSLVLLEVVLGRGGSRFYDGYAAALGAVALAVEAVLPVPQLVTNQQRHSTSGFSASVLANWLLGDLFKLAYFFGQHDNGSGGSGVPWTFRACGLFQLVCDVGLLVQWIVFKSEKQPGPGGEKKRMEDVV